MSSSNLLSDRYSDSMIWLARGVWGQDPTRDSCFYWIIGRPDISNAPCQQIIAIWNGILGLAGDDDDVWQLWRDWPVGAIMRQLSSACAAPHFVHYWYFTILASMLPVSLASWVLQQLSILKCKIQMRPNFVNIWTSASAYRSVTAPLSEISHPWMWPQTKDL